MTTARHVRVNQAHWELTSDDYQRKHGEQLRVDAAGWGVWQVREAQLRVLGDVRGLDVLELGCGAAQWSIWLAEQGARPVGLDLSRQQLDHARRLVASSAVAVPLVRASAEDLPLAGAAFDVVFCDHGAMSFADPPRTVPEAARMLRPGGLFAFCIASPLLDLRWPAEAVEPDDRLHGTYFGMHSFNDGKSLSFQLPYGDWIRLFRRHGLLIEDLIEIEPPESAMTTYGWSLEWARRWPAENIWKLRRER